MSPSTTHWPGLNETRHLIVFGDSYSQTVYPPRVKQPQPTPDRPLGVKWPGVTYNEDDEPNWVGHLVRSKPGEPLLVWNYALGGATVRGVEKQVDDEFLFHMPENFALPDRARVTRSALAERFRDTLFVIFVGINDVCFPLSISDTVARLFSGPILSLYEAGARNFLIFDNPPRMQAFGVRATNSSHSQKISAWNTALRSECEKLKEKYPCARVFILPTFDLFTEVFRKPAQYGFSEKDVGQAFRGAIWMDGLHPTSAIHKIISEKVVEVLS